MSPNDYRAMAERAKTLEPTGREQSPRSQRSEPSHKH
jgi:hypothetical protein